MLFMVERASDIEKNNTSMPPIKEAFEAGHSNLFRGEADESEYYSWVIDINSMDELTALSDKYGALIITYSYKSDWYGVGTCPSHKIVIDDFCKEDADVSN